MKMMSSRKSNSELGGWGRKMGFLLVFFHTDEEEEEEGEHNKPILPLSSPSLIKRTNSSSSSSSSHLLLHKAQSTISICLLLLFTTLLLFTLSTLPNNSSSSSSSSSTIRRHLSSSSTSAHNDHHHVHALQGMGTLYSRGSRAMSNLIIAHAVESLTLHDLKLFVRLIYRSGLTSTSDLLFLFPSTATTSSLDTAIQQETESFLKLLTLNLNNNSSSTSSLSFDPTRFFRTSKKKDNSGEPIWGRRSKSNFSEAELTRPSYGSVVGFEAEELDPENALSGFMDVKVPMSLRRWACYPMLLGRVRRNFKHVMLVDMKEVLVLGGDDQLIRGQSPESVLVMNIMKHGNKRVDPGIIMGGLRGVRRLSNAMLTAIVRASTLMKQHKRKKNSVGVTESGVLNQLVGNEFALKNINVNLMVSDESLPELVGTRLFAHMKTNNNHHHSTVIRRGGNSNSGVISSVVMKHICSFPLDSQVYSEC